MWPCFSCTTEPSTDSRRSYWLHRDWSLQRGGHILIRFGVDQGWFIRLFCYKRSTVKLVYKAGSVSKKSANYNFSYRLGSTVGELKDAVIAERFEKKNKKKTMGGHGVKCWVSGVRPCHFVSCPCNICIKLLVKTFWKTPFFVFHFMLC